VFNAANETCVDSFHEGVIGFLDILQIVERVLSEHLGPSTGSEHVSPSAGSGSISESATDVRSIWRSDDELTLDGVLDADAWARTRADELMTSRTETGRT
jgi:1-deoxy-D-xylulose-5-phosphate reductoisomerase